MILIPALIVGMTLLAFLVYSIGRTPARRSLPNPNGYDDFVEASKAIQGNSADFLTLDHESLRAALSTNTEPLRRLRLGLTRPCCLPMDFNLTNALPQLAEMKRLVQLLTSEGRLREMENQPIEAAQSYVDAIRFGNEMSRGGYLITRLVGMACEALGYASLSKVAPKLGPDPSRSIVAELEKVDAGRVTWAEVLRNERIFCTHSQKELLLHPVAMALSWWQSRGAIARAELKQKTVIAHERLLIAELALRASQAEQGHPPADLAELVGKYMTQVPLDPFGARSLVYRSQGANWLLYSLGPDGVDDGGKRMPRGLGSKGDLFFDSP